jgi:nucleotide-binding universal stress UspA family protein
LETGNRTTALPVVVAVDQSGEAAAALQTALRAADAIGTTLYVVHAVGLLEEGGFRAQPHLDELVAAARTATHLVDVAVETLLEDGPAADVVLRVAERVGAGLVVVGRRGMGAAPRPLGSVSEGVLARTSVPVLVVPA